MSSLAAELSALYQRDLARLVQEIEHFPDDVVLWETAPGVRNSAGNLALHLEGNLRDYIGRQLGGVDYTRSRKREFTDRNLTREELRLRVESLRSVIPAVIASLTGPELEKIHPQQVFEAPYSTSQFLIHLHGHFNYHLGQIDYLRRVLTQSGTVPFVQL